MMTSTPVSGVGGWVGRWVGVWVNGVEWVARGCWHVSVDTPGEQSKANQSAALA